MATQRIDRHAEQPIIIELTIAEVFYAAHIGLMRRLRALAAGHRPRYGYRGRGFATDIDGALAECAVAKYFDIFWSGNVGNIGDDVGRLQVRSTAYESGHLLIHPDDLDKKGDRAFVLAVSVGERSHRLAGWFICRDAARDGWWKTLNGDERPAYCVPQEELHAMTVLDPYGTY